MDQINMKSAKYTVNETLSGLRKLSVDDIDRRVATLEGEKAMLVILRRAIRERERTAKKSYFAALATQKEAGD